MAGRFATSLIGNEDIDGVGALATRRIESGPARPGFRDTLAAEYQRAHKFVGVPAGSILRLRR